MQCIPTYPVAERSAALGRLLEDIETLPTSEVWRVRLFAGLRRIVHEWRDRGSGLTEVLADESGPQALVLALLDARTLAILDTTQRRWRRLPHWLEHWYLLGVQDFGGSRRLLPPGRFEHFNEAILTADAADVDWHIRYGNFMQAQHCPSIECLRQAAVRVAQTLDVETGDVIEVRRRLAGELRIGEEYLSLECVEQLLEDVCSMRSLGGIGE
mmetsp:Transcript_85275/g.151051  ORF Transcript_85275/g.151051 Transcript_85275/m.151051 type:complete len:213 (-) Transcript_85275:98-736(-)